MNDRKILIITPRFPLPAVGACEQDRLEGIKQLKRLGFNVRVISKIFDFQDRSLVMDFSEQYGVDVDLLEYEGTKKRKLSDKTLFNLRRIINPFYWDGAAYEYSHIETRRRVGEIIEEWKPEIVWFDYSYLWPLYDLAEKRKIPIITRSINFEPSHFLQEDGYTFLNLLKFLPKFAGEMIITRRSDFLFAITPKEERIYRQLGVKNIGTLPLRGLPGRLRDRREIKDGSILNVFFIGSTYTVSHNRRVLEFILREIIPMTEARQPGRFRFHITGRKLPEEWRQYLGVNTVYHGQIDDMEKFLDNMDIALTPSLFGAGMQQKIFEPLCRGIPTITSPRGLASYPFRDGEHLLLAESANDFTEALIRSQDVNLRKKLSAGSMDLCRRIFSQEALDAIILPALGRILAGSVRKPNVVTQDLTRQ